MSLKKQREMEEEEMRKQGGRWVATTSTHCLSCPTYIISSHLLNCDRSVGRRKGGTRENRQRQEGGNKVEKGGEKVGFSFLFDILSICVLKERRVWDESESPIVSKEYIERKYSKK